MQSSCGERGWYGSGTVSFSLFLLRFYSLCLVSRIINIKEGLLRDVQVLQHGVPNFSVCL